MLCSVICVSHSSCNRVPLFLWKSVSFKADFDLITRMSKVKVLFVCLGNICRSPLAEAIFKTKISRKQLDHLVEADSCGTSNYHIGDLPDPRTIANAKKNGVTIHHRGRQLTPQDIAYYDFVVVMDKSNYKNVLQVEGAAEQQHKIALLRNFGNEGDAEVPDPYYGGELEFQNVFEILDRSIESFIAFLEKNQFKA